LANLSNYQLIFQTISYFVDLWYNFQTFSCLVKQTGIFYNIITVTILPTSGVCLQ
jgi:hypothetical protein